MYTQQRGKEHLNGTRDAIWTTQNVLRMLQGEASRMYISRGSQDPVSSLREAPKRLEAASRRPRRDLQEISEGSNQSTRRNMSSFCCYWASFVRRSSLCCWTCYVGRNDVLNVSRGFYSETFKALELSAFNVECLEGVKLQGASAGWCTAHRIGSTNAGGFDTGMARHTHTHKTWRKKD